MTVAMGVTVLAAEGTWVLAWLGLGTDDFDGAMNEWARIEDGALVRLWWWRWWGSQVVD